ncbi:MAG: Rpn family recombination-promoting nuclease/putative transposase [Woronichinia naegeliana WA131]|jgi:predicted transposase/invertase (TIGR01784 family)|uniref:Rpn family recombination-promoting nuclease/putative transposase n=1 Tax=Woronichinia naegeliana WA131 TaxID=2824559 RepID=A0A977KZT0_9CYAN|nr:MAG: Rpn family recombination-promoting nuclease/putative transposase [Woronichinia naegeliana WA131]
MRTDTIFYQLFLTFKPLLFELLGEPIANAEYYQFTSREIKEKAFRFDGIFIPDREDKPIYFVEVQFQNKSDFYWEFIAEINLYLNQYKPVQDWKAVALFAQRHFEVTSLTLYQQDLMNSGRIIPIYLDEVRSDSIGVGLIQLILAQESQAPVLVQQLLQRAKTEIVDPLVTHDIIDLLETVLVSKFAQLSREEIQSMFLLSDIKQTRVYQEAKQEGRQEGRQEGLQEGRQEGEIHLLIRQLSRRFGKISDRRVQVINSLTLEQLDDLGEALLDFGELADLDNWLGLRIGE